MSPIPHNSTATSINQPNTSPGQGTLHQNSVTRTVPGRRHQKPRPSGQGDAEQLVPHSLSRYSGDPVDPKVDPAPLPSVQTQHFTCCPAPALYPRSLGHRSLSHAPVTLLLRNIKSDSLLLPVPLKRSNWSGNRDSRDCFSCVPDATSPLREMSIGMCSLGIC